VLRCCVLCICICTTYYVIDYVQCTMHYVLYDVCHIPIAHIPFPPPPDTTGRCYMHIYIYISGRRPFFVSY
jgi:hypothetical protein